MSYRAETSAAQFLIISRTLFCGALLLTDAIMYTHLLGFIPFGAIWSCAVVAVLAIGRRQQAAA